MKVFWVLGPFLWIALYVAISIVYRRGQGKPLFPKAPPNADFTEAWCSGVSHRNLLTRMGGARNCLLVYVADGQLQITPIFPFNLMFLPELYGLELRANLADVTVTSKDGLFGRSLLVIVARPREETFELRMRDVDGLTRALNSRSGALERRPPPQAKVSRMSAGRIFFQVFAILWGALALSVGGSGLRTDANIWAHGVKTTATTIGHTGQPGARNDRAIEAYVVDGRRYTLTSLRGNGFYRIGDSEVVRYLPGQPSEAREDAYRDFDLLWVGLGVAMLALGILGGLIVGAYRRAMNV